MRIGLLTTFLNTLTGSELFVFDVARALRRRGHEVTCVVLTLAPDSPLPKLLRREGVTVTDALPEEGALDALVFQLLETYPLVAGRWLDVPRIGISHGPKLPEHIPPADLPGVTHLALTEEGAAFQRERGWPHVHHLPYGIDLDRFAAGPPLPEHPRRALVHSKYCDTSIVRDACAEHGIEVLELGRDSWQPGPDRDHFAGIVEVLDDGTVVDRAPHVAAFGVERQLHAVDLVFAMGRSAVEALATGRACFVYGYRDVGDGMVTPERIAGQSAVNFSGRATSRRFDRRSMAEDLGLYRAAMGEHNVRWAREHRDLESFVGGLEALLVRPAAGAPGARP